MKDDDKPVEVKPPTQAPYGFVYGGTTTSASDQLLEAQWRDAERRRDEDARDRALASKPIEEGGAVRHIHNLMTPEERSIPKASIVLDVLNRKGNPCFTQGGAPLQILADVIVPVDPAFPGELMLIIFCPRCAERMHLDQCVLQIRQSNVKWHLAPPKPGERALFYADSQTIEEVLSAGTITDSEKFTCARCRWQAVIDKNKIRTL